MNLSIDMFRLLANKYLGLVDLIHLSATCRSNYRSLSTVYKLNRLRKIMTSKDRILNCAISNTNEHDIAELIHFVVRFHDVDDSIDRAVRQCVAYNLKATLKVILFELPVSGRFLNPLIVLPVILENDDPYYFSTVQPFCSEFLGYYELATIAPNNPMKALKFVRDNIPDSTMDCDGLSAIRSARNNCSQECIDFIEEIFPRGADILGPHDTNRASSKRLKKQPGIIPGSSKMKNTFFLPKSKNTHLG